MVQYPLINSSYGNGIEGMASYINDTSGGILTPLILLVLWTVVLLSQLNSGFPRAMLTSLFIVSIIAILMTTLDFLSPTWMYVSLVMLGLSIVMVRLRFSE